MHALSVDVEDWFHILDCPQSPRLNDYVGFESRVERNTDRILEILDELSVHGTFFVLGWVADHFPALVRRIVEAGHEIGVHGYAHVLASELTDKELENDTRRAVEAVGNAAGSPPVGYRSPGGSLLERQRWLLELLLELNIKFDSSIYPRPNSLAEKEGFPIRPYVIFRRGRQYLWEYPSTIRESLGFKWAFAEGGYMRLLPLILVQHWFRQSEQHNISVSVCVHPREFDPEQPRLLLSPFKQWKTHVNIRSMEHKIKSLLKEFDFHPMGEVLDNIDTQHLHSGFTNSV